MAPWPLLQRLWCPPTAPSVPAPEKWTNEKVRLEKETCWKGWAAINVKKVTFTKISSKTRLESRRNLKSVKFLSFLTFLFSVYT